MVVAAISMLALPALWHMSWPYALLFATLGVVQLGSAVAVLACPLRRHVLRAAAAAAAVLALWALAIGSAKASIAEATTTTTCLGTCLAGPYSS